NSIRVLADPALCADSGFRNWRNHQRDLLPTGTAGGEHLMVIKKVVKKPVVALLVALPEEMDAILRYPVKWETKAHRSSPTRTYHSTRLPNGIVIVAGMAMGMGQLNAALLARDMWEL